MITLATKNDTYSIFVDKSGNIATLTGAEALAQTLGQISRTRKGELMYATNRGIPYWDTIFQTQDYQMFEAAMRSEFMRHPEVTGILSFNVSQDGDDIIYEAQVNSIYGVVKVNG